MVGAADPFGHPDLQGVWVSLSATPLTRTDEPIYEFACHEGNHYGMVGILAGAREQDRADAAVTVSGR